MLKAAVLLQSEEGCTFAPVLTSKARHAPKNDKRPVRSFMCRLYTIVYISFRFCLIQVHLRLTERGKLYNESIEQLRERMGKFDDEGNRLFTPAINKDSTRSVNHSFSSAQSPVALAGDLNAQSFNDGASSIGGQSHSHSHRGADGASTAAADEFLYQDARDREERFRVREKVLQAQIESKAAASKINSSSIVLLRRKAVSFIVSCCFAKLLCSSDGDFSYAFRCCYCTYTHTQDRDARSAFKVLTGKGEEEGNEDHYLGKKCFDENLRRCLYTPNMYLHHLGIDDVQSFVHLELGGSGKWSEEALSRHANTVWALLDTQQVLFMSTAEIPLSCRHM